MKTVLVTGATGYIGGSLAAALLARGHRVAALSRRDSDGERTRTRIRESLDGLGLQARSDWAQRLSVLPYDLTALSERHRSELAEIDAVWHAAAEMSFASKRLESSFEINIGGTHALYRLARDASPKLPRFYYVSTAYTGGIQAKSIEEKLHAAPKLVNPYFVTKWGTEMMLAEVAREPSALPITIFRPTIVVGHTKTGWYGGKSFGPYNFIDAFHIARTLGDRRIRVDIDPGIMHNYVPIDDVIDNAVALTEGLGQEPPFFVAHVAGTEMTNAERTEIIARSLGLAAELGKPRTVADHALDTWIFVNKRFNHPPAVDVRFPFVVENLSRCLGAHYRSRTVDAPTFERLVSWYRDHRLSSIAAKIDPAIKLPMHLTRWLHMSGLGGAPFARQTTARLLLSRIARAYLDDASMSG